MSKIYSSATYAERNAPRRFTRRFAMVAVAAVLTLAFATTALAVSGIIDFGTIFDSIFNNKEAAPFIQMGDSITTQDVIDESEITIEPIAAFFEPARSGLYLELRITDPTGIELSDSLLFVDSSNGNVLNTGEVGVKVIDENTIIAVLFITPVNIGETTVRFDTIASGIEWFEEAQSTQFNIGEYIGIESPIVVLGAEFVEITEVTLDGGRLTIAHRKSDASVHGYGSASLGLMKPDGEIIWSNEGAVGAGVPGQQDFYEIGDINPNDLTLAWIGNRYDNVITGNWEFTVSGENIIETRSFSGEFEGYSTQVVLGATSVEIRVFADYVNNEFPYDYHEENALTLLLKDGTTVHTRVGSILCDNTPTASFAYDINFVNPADVVSVTFYGITISG